jgi:hypothetical protein
MNVFYWMGWVAGKVKKEYQRGMHNAEVGLPIRSVTGDDNLDKIYMILQQQGSYIRAIRMYKDMFRCDTMEAKDAVSGLIAKYNLDQEKIKSQIQPDLMSQL